MSKKRKVFVIGADIYQKQLEVARKHAELYGGSCKFIKIEDYKIPVRDNYFDGFVSLDVFGHVDDLGKVLNEIYRVLKPGGVGAIFTESVLTKWNPVKYYLAKNGIILDKHNKFHINLKSREKLKKSFEDSGFTVEEMYSLKTLLFFTDPEGYYEVLKNRNDFKFIKYSSYILMKAKKIMNPAYRIFSIVYAYFELFTLGRISKSQGFFIKVRKNGTKKCQIK